MKLEPTSFAPAQLRLGDDAPAEVKELSAQIEADGGAVLAAYREPLGGHPLLFAALPVDKVEPTPFQRDVSDAHVLKLTRAMDKTRRYLDPIIAVREDGRYHTPNGGHRLTAVKELGAKSILALVVPEKEVAYQILALNIEKAGKDLSGAVDAGTDMVNITKKDRNKVFAAKDLKLKGPMSQITANQITKLESKCGADGKTLAGKMRRAVSG